MALTITADQLAIAQWFAEQGDYDRHWKLAVWDLRLRDWLRGVDYDAIHNKKWWGRRSNAVRQNAMKRESMRDRSPQVVIASAMSTGQLWKVLLSTVDGIYTVTLSAIFLVIGVWTLVDGVNSKTDLDWDWVLVTMFVPVLFVAIFIRHRIGSSISDKTPISFSLISNSPIALALIYNHWRWHAWIAHRYKS